MNRVTQSESPQHSTILFACVNMLPGVSSTQLISSSAKSPSSSTKNWSGLNSCAQVGTFAPVCTSSTRGHKYPFCTRRKFGKLPICAEPRVNLSEFRHTFRTLVLSKIGQFRSFRRPDSQSVALLARPHLAAELRTQLAHDGTTLYPGEQKQTTSE